MQLYMIWMCHVGKWSGSSVLECVTMCCSVFAVCCSVTHHTALHLYAAIYDMNESCPTCEWVMSRTGTDICMTLYSAIDLYAAIYDMNVSCWQVVGEKCVAVCCSVFAGCCSVSAVCCSVTCHTALDLYGAIYHMNESCPICEWNSAKWRLYCSVSFTCGAWLILCMM